MTAVVRAYFIAPFPIVGGKPLEMWSALPGELDQISKHTRLIDRADNGVIMQYRGGSDLSHLDVDVPRHLIRQIDRAPAPATKPDPANGGKKP